MEIILGITLAEWAAIATIFGVFLASFSRVRNYARLLWDRTFGSTAALLRQHIMEETSQLDRIEAELHPNGGNSIRDAINQIAHRQNEFDAFLRAQLNIHTVAIVRTNPEGKVTQVNRAYNRLTGYSQNEVVGDGWINAIAPSDRSRVWKDWLAAVAGAREYHEIIRFQRPDESEFTAHVHVYQELDKYGKLRGYLGVIIPMEEVDETTKI